MGTDSPFRSVAPITLALAACIGAGAPVESATHTTSADTPTLMRAESAAVESSAVRVERDAARRQLSEERARFERERRAFRGVEAARREREEVLGVMWTRLDVVDARIRAFKLAVVTLPAPKRADAESRLADVDAARVSLERQLRRLFSEPAGSWPTLRRELNVAMAALEQTTLEK